MAGMTDAELARAAPALATGLLLAALAVVALVAAHREALRRVLLRAVDPRPLALFRVAFGSCLLLGALEVAPLNLYLYSDEGLLPSAAVPQMYGKTALLGYGDGVREPAGFVDAPALLHHLASGRWSLLYFWDSPAFVRGYFAAFVLACVGLVLGWRTRSCAAITWLLYVGMLRRGDAHWAGEQVYCGFLVLLMLSRCGAALSVDNWLRCRALRRRGLLSAPDGPGAGAGAPPGPGHPQGLAAIYRRVPAWPQALLVAQLAICYAANGWAKSGPIWAAGDALLYTLHLDNYTRLDWHPLTAALGPTPLRLATWGVLWWERLFPLLLVGLWLRAAARSRAPAPTGPARALARAAWLMLAAALLLFAAHPAALVEAPGRPGSLAGAVLLALAAGLALALALGLRAPTLRIGARRVPLDRAWLARGPLAPRLWLGFGAAFHAMNFALLNVAMFAVATMTAYLLCGAGDGAVRALQRLGRALARRGVPVPEHLSRETAIAAEDPTLPQLHRDAAALPGPAHAGAGALVLLDGVLALARGPALAWWHGAWLAAGTGLVLVGWRRARRVAADDPTLPEPWAYGPAGRLAAGGVFTYHLAALLLWQLPPWPALPYRDAARRLLEPWMELSYTRQAWRMFSPNPPRSNQTLRTIVVDAAGVEHDLHSERQLPENLPRPYMWHDRWRKIDENLAGNRSAVLAPWHARYLCRRWALAHGGELPRSVALERRTAPIRPLEPGDAQARFWAEARLEPVLAIACAEAPFAQLDDEVRARHDLPPAPPRSLRYAWPKGQADTWADRRATLDPLTPLWPLLALLLAASVHVWAREDRRRHVARVAARRDAQP